MYVCMYALCSAYVCVHVRACVCMRITHWQLTGWPGGPYILGAGGNGIAMETGGGW